MVESTLPTNETAPVPAEERPSTKEGKAKDKKDKKKKEPKKPRALRNDGKHKKKAHYDSFATYIYKILKQVHPELSITGQAMAVLNSMALDLLDRIASQAGWLARRNGRHTITSRDIQTAVRVLLPGELMKHAISEGTKAVTKYKANTRQEGETSKVKAKKQKKDA